MNVPTISMDRKEARRRWHSYRASKHRELILEGPGAVRTLLLERATARPARLTRLLQAAIADSSDAQPRSVQELVRATRVPRRTLNRILHTYGLPTAKNLLAVARLCHAARALQGGCTVRAAARASRYPDPFTLSNQMVRVLGVRPGQLCAADPNDLEHATERALRARPNKAAAGAR